jgi:hypothetical protein
MSILYAGRLPADNKGNYRLRQPKHRATFASQTQILHRKYTLTEKTHKLHFPRERWGLSQEPNIGCDSWIPFAGVNYSRAASFLMSEQRPSGVRIFESRGSG